MQNVINEVLFWDANQVCTALGIGKTTLRHMIERQEFPPPEVFYRRTRRWRVEVVKAWAPPGAGPGPGRPRSGE